MDVLCTAGGLPQDTEAQQLGLTEGLQERLSRALTALAAVLDETPRPTEASDARYALAGECRRAPPSVVG